MYNVNIKEVNIKGDLPGRKLLELENLLSHGGREIKNLNQEVRKQLLNRLVLECRSCELYLKSKGPVPPEGSLSPRAIFIGRNPGKGDDIYSRPFSTEYSGGTLFKRYLRALGLMRNEIYISNMCFCNTKMNRPPTSEQILSCMEWKSIEFSLLKIPDYIFLLGNDALRWIMGRRYPSIERVYGDLYLGQFKGEKRLFIPIHHPGYLVRNPDEVENTFTLIDEVSKITRNPSFYNLDMEAM